VGHRRSSASAASSTYVQHGTHEFFQMKHRLLELLVGRPGVRLFVLQDEDTLCRAVDAYVQGDAGDVHDLMSNLFPVVRE
jgi:erythromycin esterase-like protein